MVKVRHLAEAYQESALVPSLFLQALRHLPVEASVATEVSQIAAIRWFCSFLDPSEDRKSVV
jgi:hypothetical protein